LTGVERAVEMVLVLGLGTWLEMVCSGKDRA
jgi:hypothetical protein